MRDPETLVLSRLLHSQVAVAIFSWRNEESWPVEFVSPNVRSVLGYGAEDFLSGRVVYAGIIHPDDLARVTREVVESGASGVPVFEHEDYRVVDPEGRVRWVQDNTAIVRDEKGQITHYFGYILDSTARHEALLAHEQARRTAEEATRSKSEFLASVSHELRTPLALMLGPLEALLVGEAGALSDAAVRSLERVRRNAERQRALVDDLLDFARLDAGHGVVDWEPLDLGALSESLVDEARAIAGGRNLELSFTAPGEPVIVSGDRRKVDQILLNLLTNAIKFTPAGGRIAVSVSTESGAAELAVADSGPGIPADQLERIFDRFHQIDSSAARPQEGAGLGLALVRSLAELLGGTIAVQSRLGEGSRFSLRLPWPVGGRAPPLSVPLRASRSSESAARLALLSPVETPPRRPASASRPRIIVADDNSDMRAFLTELLEQDYDVEAVDSGAAALSTVRRDPPAVLICDAMMPGMDGLAVARTLKADPAHCAIPVILVTARASRDDLVAGLRAGADDYLAKPFDAAELRARVLAAERLHRTYQELQDQRQALAEAHEQLHATQRQLVEAGKLAAAGALAAGIAHELNNPMATILLNTQWLLRGLPAESPVRPRLTAIEQQTLRCRTSIRTLLDYARNRAPHSGRIAVAQLLEEVRTLARAQMSGRDLRLDSAPLPELPPVAVSVQEVQAAMLNLLGNAADATPRGGAVTLSARARAFEGRPGVEIAVSDRGPGIPEAVLPHIFEPFYTTKPPGQGTGLGLALAQRMISNCGGHIEVETAAGQGTTMRVWLPAWLDPGEERRDP